MKNKTKKLPDFDKLWDNYPRGTPEEVKIGIGGNVNAAWITNICAIRLSRAFNKSGEDIPRNFKGLNTVRGRDGKRYAFRVREFEKFMTAMFGPPTIKHVYKKKGGKVPDSIRNTRGIVLFDVRDWSDATGHLTLWDGSSCADRCYFEVARKIRFWPESEKDSDSVVLPTGKKHSLILNADGSISHG